MSQKSILITGCSSGIGYDAAHTLAKRGWRVLATCRAQKDCERLISEGLESFVLDYASDDSVQAGAEQALELTGGELFALFNNGAHATPGAVEDLPRDALRANFETNLFGQFDLINRLLPSMKKNQRGRIINNSSVLGFLALKYRGAYNSTKFAMEGLTDTLRIENIDSPVKIILIEPGPITSSIRQNSIAHFEKWINWENSAHAEAYRNILKPRLYDKNTTPDRFELPASAVTKKLIHALDSDRPKPRYYVTTPTYIAGIVKRFCTTRGVDRFASRG